MPINDEDRKRLGALGNPYAFVDQCDGASDLQGAVIARPSSVQEQVSASRKILQNPYAYLDGDGGYGCIPRPTRNSSSARRDRDSVPSVHVPRLVKGAKQRRYTDREIEARVADIHKLLWKERSTIVGASAADDPIAVLDPGVALRFLGYAFDSEEGIGQHRVDGVLLEVAGVVDYSEKTVRVSRQFPPSVQMFTAAHELGHAALHRAQGGIHRDKPIDGSARSREPAELEADKFASHFLMPAKLLRSRFSRIFGSDNLVLTEETAFALAGAHPSDLRQHLRTRRDLSRLIAGAERYGRIHFVSLASQFRVSVEAMAIRLEELRLVGD